MDTREKIFIAGDRSQTAKDLRNILFNNGFSNVVSCNSETLDLRDQATVNSFFQKEKPDYVILVAARRTTPKDHARTPYDVVRDNLGITINTLDACVRHNVKRVIYFSSAQALPLYDDDRVIDETALMSAPIIGNIESHALSKLVGIKICNYVNVQLRKKMCISLLPSYIYGNLSVGSLFSMTKDICDAKERNDACVTIWGDKDSKINLIHSRDLAEAAFYTLNNDLKYDTYFVGAKSRITKGEIAKLITKAAGYQGQLLFDKTKVVNTSQNVSSKRIHEEGWSPCVSVEDGLAEMVEWYMSNERAVRDA